MMRNAGQTGFSRQGGFSIVSAIFIVTVLAALAAFSMSISAVQHSSTALSLHSARVNLAAYSGTEWAIAYVQNNNACPAAGSNFVISPFTVTVTQCNQSALITEGADTYRSYTLRLTASSTGKVLGDTDFVASTKQVVIKGL